MIIPTLVDPFRVRIGSWTPVPWVKTHGYSWCALSGQKTYVALFDTGIFQLFRIEVWLE